MQIKKKFTDESFGNPDPDVILNKANNINATIESVSVIKVMNFLFLFLRKIDFDDL